MQQLELIAGAHRLWYVVTALCAMLAVLQALRSSTRKGDLLTTYLSDLLTLFIVFDVASSPKALGFGAVGAATKAGVTLLRARKEKS
jgi:hypothetical protein